MTNAHFEMAAAGLLLLNFLCYRRQKHIPIRRNQIFYILFLFVIMTTYLDVMCQFLEAGAIPTSQLQRYVLQETFLNVHLITGVLYNLYVFSIIDHHKSKLHTHKLIYLFMLLGVVTNIVLPYSDASFYGQAIILAGFSFLVCVFQSKWISKHRLLDVIGMAYILCLAVFVQIFIGDRMQLMFLVDCLVMFICCMTIQNSDYYVDEMTGLFTMQGFEEVMKERFLQGKKSVIMIMRIKNYTAMTEIYDDYHLSQIQQEIVRIMSREFPHRVFYHISSSSFAVIAENIDTSTDIYFRLLQRTPKTWKIDQEDVMHEYSFYQVECPDKCDNMKELMQRVNYARSDHPGHHKSGVLIQLSHQTVEEAEYKQKILLLLDEALMDNSIEIHFQPIYSMKEGYITSLEVLARLKDKDKNYINPELFIQVAEENKMIVLLGEQIYQKACVFAKQNHLFELGIEDININLSPIQCCYDGLVQDLVKIARQNDVPMWRMHLEITESAVMDRREIRQTLQGLSEAGAKIALDDFGTGYSSMTSIMKLPISFVKIDKSLVWSYSRGENLFLQDLIPMIHSEGKKIIAEGIETEEQLEMLDKLHGDYIQGYYFSKPLPGPEFIHYIKKVNRRLQ